jgi:hypothetical protein
MSTTLSAPQTRTPKLSFAPHAVVRWFHARIDAFHQSIEHRPSVCRLQELRDRDPRLFEEMGIDQIDLPPPSTAAVTVFPHAVISSYFLKDRP